MCVAPRWLPALSERERACCAAKTPRKSWVRSFPGVGAGGAGTGEQRGTLRWGRRAARCSRLERRGTSHRLRLQNPVPGGYPWGECEGWHRQGQRRGTAPGDSMAPGLQLCRATPHAAEVQALRAQRRVLGPARPRGVFSRAQRLCGAAPARRASPSELILYLQAASAECPGVREPGRAAKGG